MKLVLGALAFVAGVVPQSAPRHIVVIAAELSEAQRGLVAVDMATVRKIGAYPRGWVFAAAKVGQGEAVITNSLMEADCAEEKFHYLQQTYFHADHSFDFNDQKPREWEYAIPGSRSANAMKLICGQTPEGLHDFGDINPFELADRLFKAKP